MQHALAVSSIDSQARGRGIRQTRKDGEKKTAMGARQMRSITRTNEILFDSYSEAGHMFLRQKIRPPLQLRQGGK